CSAAKSEPEGYRLVWASHPRLFFLWLVEEKLAQRLDSHSVACKLPVRLYYISVGNNDNERLDLAEPCDAFLKVIDPSLEPGLDLHVSAACLNVWQRLTRRSHVDNVLASLDRLPD